MKCSHCNITLSILPSFLIPYFQHTTIKIVMSIYNRLLRKLSPNLSRQLIFFYLQRFKHQFEWILSFLKTSQSDSALQPNNVMNLSTISIILNILKIGVIKFHLASFGYQSSYFMSPQPLLSQEST
jgi:hypothetical protein